MTELTQKAEWRARLMTDVLSNMHDEETRAELLFAGLDQAHHEGLGDAADICDGIAKAKGGTRDGHVAAVIASAIRELARKNKRPTL